MSAKTTKSHLSQAQIIVGEILDHFSKELYAKSSSPLINKVQYALDEAYQNGRNDEAADRI